jgi:hypothetical protein
MKANTRTGSVELKENDGWTCRDGEEAARNNSSSLSWEEGVRRERGEGRKVRGRGMRGGNIAIPSISPNSLF